MHSFVSMNVLARVLEKAGMREIKPIPNAGTPSASDLVARTRLTRQFANS